MSDFLHGNQPGNPSATLDKSEPELFDAFERIGNEKNGNEYSGSRRLSKEADAVLSAGRNLWRYYHSQSDANTNAALYDIKLHFQGRNEKGKMNTDSPDEEYIRLLTSLKTNLKVLAKKIEPKVYKHGFLKS